MRLEEVARKFEHKLKKIKVAAFDVDGVLTDCHVWWESEEVGFNRSFCIYDGYGMKLLMNAGIKVGIITGGNSISVMKRSQQLGLDFCHAGNEDKREAFKKIMEAYHVKADEILYMGDELFDLPLLKLAGFSATVPNTTDEVKGMVDYVSVKESGKGCVREVIDILRYAQNIRPMIEGL